MSGRVGRRHQRLRSRQTAENKLKHIWHTEKRNSRAAAAGEAAPDTASAPRPLAQGRAPVDETDQWAAAVAVRPHHRDRGGRGGADQRPAAAAESPVLGTTSVRLYLHLCIISRPGSRLGAAPCLPWLRVAARVRIEGKLSQPPSLSLARTHCTVT